MPYGYIITSDPTFFKNPSDEYRTPYRCIILHALYNYLSRLKLTKDWKDIRPVLVSIKEELQKFNLALNPGSDSMEPFIIEKLFEIYLFKTKDDGVDKIGALFVDKSESEDPNPKYKGHKGVYPLVFYPKENNPDASTRKTALIMSLSNILNKWDSIIEDYFIPNIDLKRNFSDIKDDACSILEKIPGKNAGI